MLWGTTGGLQPKLLLKTHLMFDHPYRKIVFLMSDCILSCFSLHPWSPWKAEMLYLAFHVDQYHEAFNPSPVQLSLSTFKFIFLSSDHILIPANSPTYSLHCFVFLPWYLQADRDVSRADMHNTGGCSLSYWLNSSLSAHSTSESDFYLLSNRTVLFGPATSFVTVLDLMQ